MESTTDLPENPGYRLVGDTAEVPAEWTVLVIGIGRSGTSFISSVLKYYDVFLGDKPSPTTLEDARLIAAIDERSDEKVSDVVRDYDGKHGTWAFKWPKLVYTCGDLIPHLRNPRLIITHRDPFAVAIRNELAIKRPFKQGLRMAVKHNQALYAATSKIEAPALHIAFELIDRDKVTAAKLIGRFIGRPPLDEACERALSDYLGDRRTTYLRHARIDSLKPRSE